MKKILFALATVLTTHQIVDAQQCVVKVTSNIDTVVCGDAATLSVSGRGQGAVVFEENFNSGAPSGWAFTQQATFTNPCSPAGVDGTPHIWMGSQSASPRSLETNPYNFSGATAGATICFDLLLAPQGNGNPPPCEGPDRPDEGIYLQYKIGNGPWVTVHYFDPSGGGGNDPALINWNNWCFQLPQAALTSNVSIRWFQTIDSGADYDHWGIDNVQIYFNDPNYTISAANTLGQNVYTFPQGSSGGSFTVAPKEKTTYVFEMTHAINGDVCRDSITVFVKDPFFEITAGRDTTVCAGKCAVLSSSAKVVKSYEKTVTFANNQLTQIATGIAGAATAIDVTVGGMNNTTIQSGMIQSVCITNLGFFGFNLFPPGQQTIGDLRIRLLCPDSTAIVLVPAGVTTSTSPLTGYTNTCFTIGSTTNIATGTPPYTGSYQPNQPFSNLNGCSTNGVWKMEISTANAASFGSGTFLGWSITLRDPEISYNGNFVWSPTTDMTNPTSPTPTICPTATRDYVIAVSDTANCKTVSDTVTVTVQQNCCNFTIATTATQPTCGASNGAITITPTPQGTYTYLWNDNNTTSSRTGLAAGTYRVTVTDVANGGCTRDTTIILNSNSTLSLQLTNPVNPGCGTPNGSVTVGLSGGTAPYVVTITSGGNTQTLNVPIAITQAVPNLAAGTYTIVVTDAQQCQQTQIITLTLPSSPGIISIARTTETCLGDNNATATVNATGGTGTFIYVWSNQQTTQTATGLAPNTYTVTVSDNNSCTATGSVTITPGPTCCTLNLSASVTQPACGATNGSITVTATPQATYTYNWSAGGSTTATNSNLGIGTYRVTVTNTANNCSKDTAFTLSNSNGPTIDSFKIKNVSCNSTNDGSVTVSASSPAGVNVTAGFKWSNDNDSTDTQSDLAVGTYFFTVTDLAGCQTTGSVQIAKDPSCCPFRISAAATPSGCTTNNGSIQVSVTTPGATPYEYSINGTSYQQATSFSNLAAGSYTVYARDANGCADTVTVSVTSPANNISLTLVPTDPNCTNANSGNVIANVAGGTGNISYTWSNSGGSSNTISNLAAGTYSVTVTDGAGCSQTSSTTLNPAQPIVIDLGNNRSFCAGANATLNAPIGFATYLWSTGEITESINVDSSSVYSVTVTNASGCTAEDGVSVTVNPNPDVTLPTDTSLYENNPLVLKPSIIGSTNNATYLWTPSEGLSCNDCANPVANPDDTTSYQVLFTDANGCADSTTIKINVLKGAKIYMPNVFSPNGDTKNDILLPKSIGVKSITWKVFNRWGELVFVTNDLNVGWDGTFNGAAQPTGVYVYTMQVAFRNNTSNSYNGSVTLIR